MIRVNFVPHMLTIGPFLFQSQLLDNRSQPMAWSLNSRQRRGITARPGHTIPTSWYPTLHDSTRDCRNLRKTVEFGKATSEYPVHFTFEPPLCLSGSDASR